MAQEERIKFEIEFFRLAANFLQCRQHALSGEDKRPLYTFLGEIDSETEMYLLIEEKKNEIKRKLLHN